MYLQINPGYRILPHSEDRIQIGISEHDNYLISTPTLAHERILEHLREGIEFEELFQLAEHASLDTDSLKTLLQECDKVLLRTPYPPQPPEHLAPQDRFWQASTHSDTTSLQKRRGETSIFIHGLQFSGYLTALTVAEAGIRKIYLCDEQIVHRTDTEHGHFLPEHKGRRRSVALKEIIEERFPEAECIVKQDIYEPLQVDLAISFHKYSYPQDFSLRMSSLHIPQLYVQHHERSASIGPLVIPGESACINCIILNKEKQIPGWRNMQEQLAIRNQELEKLSNFYSYEEHSTGLTIAGLASIHALLFLDGFTTPTSVNGLLTVETEFGELLHQEIAQNSQCFCASEPAKRVNNSSAYSSRVSSDSTEQLLRSSMVLG